MTFRKFSWQSKKNRFKRIAWFNYVFFLLIFLIMVVMAAESVQAFPTASSVTGKVFGPGKVGSLVTGRLLQAQNNNLTLDIKTDGISDTRGDYFITLSYDTADGSVWIEVNSTNNGGEVFGYEVSRELANSEDAYLNITMHADIGMISPGNNARLNFTRPDFNWSYPEYPWMNYTLYLDDDSDFSSPMVVKNLNSANYTLEAGEALVDGTYYWKIETHDTNYSKLVDVSETRQFEVDTLMPAVVDVSPENQTWTKSGINIIVETNEDTFCRFDNRSGISFENKKWNMSGLGTTHEFYFNFTYEGNHSFNFQCNDSAGNIMDIDDEWLHIINFENTSPLSQDNFTLNDTWTRLDQTINISVNDSFPSSGINWTRYCTTPGCNPEEGTDYISPLVYSEGVYTLRYSSSDMAGNIEPTKELAIRIDQSPPTTSHNFTENNTWVNNDQSISLSFSDPAESSGEAWTRFCTGLSICVPGTDYSDPLDITSNGDTWVRYHSSDTVGNTQEIVSLLVRLDKISPECSGASLEIENDAVFSDSNMLDFNWSGFSDPISGLIGYYHAWEDNEFTSSGNFLFGNSASRNGAAEGNVSIYVWSRDNAGNIGCSVTDSIIVDTLPPEFSIFEQQDYDEKSSGSLNVNVTINDDTTNVTHLPEIRYRYGAEAWGSWQSMSLVSYNSTGGKYTFYIPEPLPDWNAYRYQDIRWQFNASDYLNNTDLSLIQTETIEQVNDPPVLDFIMNQTTPSLETLKFNITATDIDNDGIDSQTLTYSSNESDMSFTKYNNTLSEVSWTPDNYDVGLNPVNISVTDDGTPVREDWQIMYINVSFVNEPPVLEPIGDLFIDENSNLFVEVNASDPNGDGLIFEDDTHLFDINGSTGVIDFTPKWNQVGVYTINISVRDDNPQGSLYDYEILTLTVNNVENNVTFLVQDTRLKRNLSSIHLEGGVVCSGGCDFDESMKIIEPNGFYTYNFSKPGFLENITLLNVDDEMNHTIYMQDSQDPYMEGLEINYTLAQTQESYNATISINATDNFVMRNVSFYYTLDCENREETSIINMSPKQGGIYSASIDKLNISCFMSSNITALDIYGNSLTNINPETNFIFVNGGLLVNYPPVLVSIGDQYAPVIEPFSYQVKAIDVNGDDITFSDNSTLFNISNTTGWINFTPKISDIGTYDVSITASDSNFTDSETITFTIDKGNNITFILRDSLLGTALEDVTVFGGVRCAFGCGFDDRISIMELLGTYNYSFRKEGYLREDITIDVSDGYTQNINMADISPPEVDVMNITARLLEPDNKSFMIDYYFNITDHSQLQSSSFLWGHVSPEENIQDWNSSSGSIYRATLGPFTNTTRIFAAVNVTDAHGNNKLHKGFVRDFFFEAGVGLVQPHMVIVKNIDYISQTIMNITYRVEEIIYNTAGDDLENIQFLDSDFNNSFMSIDIPKQSSYTLQKDMVIPKAASSTVKTFQQAAANVFGEEYYSNQPEVLIPGYGGPFDLIVNADDNNLSIDPVSSEFILINQNPEFGQDAILSFQLKNSSGHVMYSRVETLFVPRSGNTTVSRDMMLLDKEGVYTVDANITWPINQYALALDTFRAVRSHCTDGVQDGDETGIDCGGSCPEACGTCHDSVKNNGETDVDCGGPICEPCSDFKSCEDDFDCESLNCVSETCLVATCYDSVKNQGEKRVDCGGPCDACPEPKEDTGTTPSQPTDTTEKTTTTIKTEFKDNASMVAINKIVSPRIFKFGDEVEVTLHVRRYLKYSENVTLDEEIPDGFKIVDAGGGRVEGNKIYWEFELKGDPGSVISYKLKYDEEYESSVKVSELELVSEEDDLLYRKNMTLTRIRPLTKRLSVIKNIKYFSERPEAEIEYVFENTGELDIPEFIIIDPSEEHMFNNSNSGLIILENGRWKFKGIKEGKKEIVRFTTHNEDNVEQMPDILNIDSVELLKKKNIYGEKYSFIEERISRINGILAFSILSLFMGWILFMLYKGVKYKKDTKRSMMEYYKEIFTDLTILFSELIKNLNQWIISRKRNREEEKAKQKKDREVFLKNKESLISDVENMLRQKISKNKAEKNDAFSNTAENRSGDSAYLNQAEMPQESLSAQTKMQNPTASQQYEPKSDNVDPDIREMRNQLDSILSDMKNLKR